MFSEIKKTCPEHLNISQGSIWVGLGACKKNEMMSKVINKNQNEFTSSLAKFYFEYKIL